jgi:hypothetical protein
MSILAIIYKVYVVHKIDNWWGSFLLNDSDGVQNSITMFEIYFGGGGKFLNDKFLKS